MQNFKIIELYECTRYYITRQILQGLSLRWFPDALLFQQYFCSRFGKIFVVMGTNDFFIISFIPSWVLFTSTGNPNAWLPSCLHIRDTPHITSNPSWYYHCAYHLHLKSWIHILEICKAGSQMTNKMGLVSTRTRSCDLLIHNWPTYQTHSVSH